MVMTDCLLLILDRDTAVVRSLGEYV